MRYEFDDEDSHWEMERDAASDYDDPEVAKALLGYDSVGARKQAKADMKKDQYPLYTGNNELENPLDSDVNNVPGESSDDQELEELLLDPIDSNVNDVPGESTDDGVRELDLDELTNMVNGSVKETLGKYFE